MESICLREALLCAYGSGHPHTPVTCAATAAGGDGGLGSLLGEVKAGFTGVLLQGRVVRRYEHVCPCAHGHSQAAGQVGLGVRM